MPTFAHGTVFALYLCLATLAGHAHAKDRDILIHQNALVCRSVDSLEAGIAAWQSRSREAFDTHMRKGDCLLTHSTGKGRLLSEEEGRASLVIEVLFVNGRELAIPAGTVVWAMQGTYSDWPEHWRQD